MLLALAVWCQKHGPRVILTTQHRRPSKPSPVTYNLHNGHCNSNIPPATSTTTSDSISSLASSETSPQHPADTVDSGNTNATTHSTHSLEPKRSRRSLQQSPSTSTDAGPCECQFSVPTGERSVQSIDPANTEMSYVSQPAPVDGSLFAPIRSAGIRSLSSEAYSGREGSVFFGDGESGYVVSYIFTVFDAQSRGHRVKYAIMAIMTDRVYLVANMDYLISQFQMIASNLQSMASSLRVPQQSPAARSLLYSSSHQRGSIMPESGPTKKGRPLMDVLAKPDIYVQLHAAFVSVLSNCSQRLTERHIQGGSMMAVNSPSVSAADTEEQPKETIDSLRELRRVLGGQKFDRLLWNSLVGNQVIVRGSEARIVKEVIKTLKDILPKDCYSVIIDSSTYEPSYACNVLGLDRSIPIPADLDPEDFILLDVCMTTFGQQAPAPPTSLPSCAVNKTGANSITPVYQADWLQPPLSADLNGLAAEMEKTMLENSNILASSLPHRGQSDINAPTVLPDSHYSSSGGFQAQRRIYLLQAGEEAPDPLLPVNKDDHAKLLQGRKPGLNGSNGRYSLFVEAVNEILDQKMPRPVEEKRFALLRQDWISKAKQFHNLHKAGCASNEAIVDNFLCSMNIDRRDLKILRFFTRCARSSNSRNHV